MIGNIVGLIIGFLLLIKGADFFVEGASKIAEKFHIPQIVIGLTIVAFGTSAPEAAISINAALQGNAGISIGNVVGSNIMNILLILGITAVIAKVPVKKTTLQIEMPFVVVITLVLLLLGKLGGQLSRLDGGILWVLFLFFLYYLYRLSKKGNGEGEEETSLRPKDTIPRLLILTLVGLICIVVGSDVTVNGATGIAKAIGISDRIIGLTVVAFGTSLPELITSTTAAMRGKTDIAVGNIVGSNIFNILFVIGTAALISPIGFADKFIFDTVMAIIAAILLFAFCFRKRELTRVGGIFMLLIYAAYFIYIL